MGLRVDLELGSLDHNIIWRGDNSYQQPYGDSANIKLTAKNEQ
jgi:hypothetical protein